MIRWGVGVVVSVIESLVGGGMLVLRAEVVVVAVRQQRLQCFGAGETSGIVGAPHPRAKISLNTFGRQKSTTVLNFHLDTHVNSKVSPLI